MSDTRDKWTRAHQFVWTVAANHDFTSFRNWAESGAVLRYTIGAPETSTHGRVHRHIAVELRDASTWGHLAARFKGYWKIRGDWLFEQLEEYVGKEGIDEAYTGNGGGNPGGSICTTRSSHDIRAYFQASSSENSTRPTENGDILRQAVVQSGLDDGLNAWLQSPGPSQLSSGVGGICHLSGVDLNCCSQRSRPEFSPQASVCDTVDSALFSPDVYAPSQSVGDPEALSCEEIASISSKRRCLSLSRKRNSDRQSVTSRIHQDRSPVRCGRDEESVLPEKKRRSSEMDVQQISSLDCGEGSLGGTGEAEVIEEEGGGGAGTSGDQEDEYIARERLRITEPGRVYGVADIPTLLLKIFGRASLLREPGPGSWLIRHLNRERESVRRARLVKAFWGYNRKIASKLQSNKQGQKGRCITGSGGEYRLVCQTMKMDYYMKFSTLTRIHPMMFNDGNVWEKKRDLMLPKAEPAEQVISVWICGDGGVGKSRFVTWFVKYCLDQRVYKLPYSHEYKWWDGYILEKVIHIEELDLRSRMVVSQVKTLLDYDVIKVEKKGSVTQPVRPWIFFITSNFTPVGVFGAEWDDAMQSRFSTERYTPQGKPAGGKWSQDLVWQINNQAGFQMLFEKLKTLFPDYPGMPAEMDPNFHFTALRNPVTWVNYEHVLDL